MVAATTATNCWVSTRGPAGPPPFEKGPIPPIAAANTITATAATDSDAPRTLNTSAGQTRSGKMYQDRAVRGSGLRKMK